MQVTLSLLTREILQPRRSVGAQDDSGGWTKPAVTVRAQDDSSGGTKEAMPHSIVILLQTSIVILRPTLAYNLNRHPASERSEVCRISAVANNNAGYTVSF